ncbi:MULTISPECIES: hypothetical protein [unclassified Massilia]|uniref:hypothetical protein n=1 Tax=unclassified Massilia TaxID=2609279 RepID=UPI0017819E2F|nr:MULTISPECIES: hypothetical protein [unclassified Massilia]MBD8531913.1 hypothetical protein [Massilia sp. CFBP 13647]MBD8675359.1 hypothetical protein [Massilia sp. CFBP 13721]
MKKACMLLSLLVSGAAVADDAAVLKCRALPDAASRLVCYDAMPLAGAAATMPAAAPVAAAAPASSPVQDFGRRPPAPKKEEVPASIRSTVVGTISGWSPGSRITLANGQVWRVVDGDAVLPVMNNPQAEVSRGLLGAYFLQVGGHTSAARVTRVDQASQ